MLPKSAPFEKDILTTYWGKQSMIDFEWGMSHQNVNKVNGNSPSPSSAAKNQLAMGAVYPGFDDTNVPTNWNNGIIRKLLRYVNDGITYNFIWNHILNYIPNRYGGDRNNIVEMPWVQIITWNDYPEGTQIEPGNGCNGTMAYEQTLLYISRWKSDANTDKSKGEQQEMGTKMRAILIVNISVDILNARRVQKQSEEEDGEEKEKEKEEMLTVGEVDDAVRCLLLGDLIGAKRMLVKTVEVEVAAPSTVVEETTTSTAAPSSEEGGGGGGEAVKEDDKLSGARRYSEASSAALYVVIVALAVVIAFK